MNTVKSKLFYIFPILFSVITLIIALLRIPFWDETHAFEIARLNFSEILYLTRIEGHYLLWYLILKPFSSISLYPYPMLIINWLFCVGAVFVLWLKSPFDNIEKILITFSSPFVFYFAPVSRCYSVGIFFLFLICALFKDRYKKYRLFSTLLLICSNTSLMAFIPCFYIWLIYLFQLFKKKSKNFKTCFMFFIANLLLFIIQFFNLKKPYVSRHDSKAYIDMMMSFLVVPYDETILKCLFHIVVFVLFYGLIIFLFKKSKYAFYFLMSSFVTLTFLFLFFCNGSLWNYFFYYIYLILILWLFKRQILNNKIIKSTAIILFIFLCFSHVMYKKEFFERTYTSKSKLIAKELVKNQFIKEANLYCLDWWSDISPASDIYFKKAGIDILDVNGYKRTSFESIKNVFLYRIMPVDLDKFYNSLDKSKKNYIITDNTFFDMDKINSDKYLMKQIFYNQDLKYGIYELVKKY